MQNARAVREQDLCCFMSTPADRPEVVQLPAETPTVSPVSNRRAAAQRVREARDRLTSTSGTRPAFDRELLRPYAQTRISASYVVMLLVVATGLLFGFWLQPVSAGRGPAACCASMPPSSAIASGSWPSRPPSPPRANGKPGLCCSTYCTGCAGLRS